MPKKAAKTPKTEKTAKKGTTQPCLVIVESPAKERTIARLLKGSYVVRSSFGHVRDLPVKKLGVDPEKDFAPQYVVLPRAKKLLPELRELAERSPAVYLATDHDREGESIAWHLVELLGLEADKVRRITFHEITPSAITEALAAPRSIDNHLVNAQQARRVIDRLVGYLLSPLLWAKVQSGLSAGRVQSVAVRLIAERDREINAFASETFWTLGAALELPGSPPPFEARLSTWQGEKVETVKTTDLFAEQYRVKTTTLKTPEQVRDLEAALRGAPFKVVKVERRELRRRPPAPFSTSTLQQAASQKLGFAAERTMRVAQTLYEGVDLGGGESVGLITYMRTDSFFISKVAAAEAAAFAREHYGPEFVPAQPPTYQTKARGAQEAHEAIRPTGVARRPEDLKAHLNSDQARLYELIWKRFLSSQMTEALYDTVAADIESGPALFRSSGRTLKFEGFLKVHQVPTPAEADAADEAEEGEEEGSRLPQLAEGDLLQLRELKPEEHKSSPPPCYNEASLIKAMEKHGIGRPSTYAPTIKTIVDRGYVRRGLKDRRLLPTDLGLLVTEKLKQHFPDVVSLSYTAEVEERLDQIAEGHETWTRVVGDFYQPFNRAVQAASVEMTVSKVAPKQSDEKCPVCTQPMLIRESRFGKYLSCSAFPKCKGKIQLGPDGQKIVPEKTEEVCDVCGKPMVIRTGRKGRFLACSGYPACKNTFSLDADGKKIEGSRPLATSRKCQKCGNFMWLRLGKRGHFLACSGFPKCRNIKPVSKEDGETLRLEAEALRAQRTPQA
ncbi:MAG: type I DNA topoisomerase [Elusimicrobia bacterium]|nr:type I DNA topoisomerase [Elusimicrobiota bacterium]